MSAGGRAPWWYSGDEEPQPREEPTERAPEPEPDAGQGGGLDWSTLLAGAQRMVDWATERVMAPHAEHDDPAAYPDCLVCRTLVLVSDSGSGPAPSAAPPAAAAPITWIPVREDPSGTASGQ